MDSSRPTKDSPPPAWLLARLAAPPAEADAFADYLARLSGRGVLLEDLPGGEVAVTGYLAMADAAVRRGEISAWAAARGLGEGLAFSALADQDWGQGWKKHFAPFVAAPGLVIAPPWHQPAPRAGERVLVIDPGMAFGTGQHETTLLCLDYLAGRAAAGRMPARVLDVGCGTGVLAMAALLMGSDSALGLDNDPEAVAAARHNAGLNRLAGRFAAEPTPPAAVTERFPLVLANIILDTLLALAPALAGRLAPGGELALAGVLGDQVDQLVRAFAPLGLRSRRRRDRGEWSLLVLA